jgi:RHH-type proline utilization regulon transcriptional repressor/proline dehydrogenase/delta 1-pyrroline-5-carboxylate dehydrogenase
VYTDVSYLACAKKLLAVPSLIYRSSPPTTPHRQPFISWPGRTTTGQYEFQCLHGMGEPLYEQVVGKVADGN